MHSSSVPDVLVCLVPECRKDQTYKLTLWSYNFLDAFNGMFAFSFN